MPSKNAEKVGYSSFAYLKRAYYIFSVVLEEYIAFIWTEPTFADTVTSANGLCLCLCIVVYL